MGGLAGGGNDDTKAVFHGVGGQLLGGGRGAVGGDDTDFSGDAELLQTGDAGAHGVQIGVGTHDDGNLFAHKTLLYT